MLFGLTASTARDESDESGRGSRPANSLERLLTASPFPEAGELGTRESWIEEELSDSPQRGTKCSNFI